MNLSRRISPLLAAFVVGGIIASIGYAAYHQFAERQLLVTARTSRTSCGCTNLKQ